MGPHTNGRMRLRSVGFCGADDSVDPRLLCAISAQHEWVEWGVLFRDEKQGSPRYASPQWLERLRAANRSRRMRLAAHLCGSHVDDVLRGDPEFVRKMHNDVGFQRVQINATAANGVDVAAFSDADGVRKCVDGLQRVFSLLPQVEFILQLNAQTAPLWEALLPQPPTNLSVLYDDSMGLGVSSESWPEPTSRVPFGFAGGLSPENLAGELSKMDAVAGGQTVWVDMESSLRTRLVDSRDIFDCNKAMACVDKVIARGYKPDVEDGSEADDADAAADGTAVKKAKIG